MRQICVDCVVTSLLSLCVPEGMMREACRFSLAMTTLSCSIARTTPGLTSVCCNVTAAVRFPPSKPKNRKMHVKQRDNYTLSFAHSVGQALVFKSAIWFFAYTGAKDCRRKTCSSNIHHCGNFFIKHASLWLLFHNAASFW